MENTSVKKQLHTQHYATVPFSLSQSELSEAAHIFLRFLDIPEEVLRKLHVPSDIHRRSADGYTNKLDVPDKDRKRFFHWRPELIKHDTYREIRDSHVEAQAFFMEAEKIYMHVADAVHNIFLSNFPDFVERIFDLSNDKPTFRCSVLRFLSYEPTSTDALCAKGHFDKGFCTFALAESTPGLRIGKDEATLSPIQHADYTAIFMPGMMFHDATNGSVKPSWHDVVHSSTEQRISTTCARWAIVFFIELPDIQFSSWEKVHTIEHA